MNLQIALKSWYKKNARKLPWREDCSAYKTVVSEFMLQQTQVDTVLGYFDRWMKRFPSFESLAQASEEEVVKMWEGLGYYSRAKNLRLLAQKIVTLDPPPQLAQDWLQFKGIGDYTSAAIASIAFGDPVAVVDGNVIRVLSRLTASNILFKGNTEAAKHFKSLANEILDKTDPGDHNQAMMELGAKVCTRHNPNCTLCPIKAHCLAHKNGNPEDFPNFIQRKTQQRIIERLLCINSDKILLFRANEKAKRLSSIYELPERNLVHLSKDAILQKIFEKNRGISNERIREIVYKVNNSSNFISEKNPDLHWIPLSSLNSITLSGPHRQWLNAFMK